MTCAVVTPVAKPHCAIASNKFYGTIVESESETVVVQKPKVKEVESFEEEAELLALRHAALQSKRYQNDGDQDGPQQTVSITCRHTYVSHRNKIMVNVKSSNLTNLRLTTFKLRLVNHVGCRAIPWKGIMRGAFI